MRASKEKKLATKCTDQAFISKGFHNWKDATVAFNKHEKTGCHKDAVQMVVVLPKCYKDCGEMLSSQHAKEKADNRQLLYKILTNVQYLARQGLPLRGDGTEDDSNYTQLLRLRGIDDLRVFDWMKRKSSKYTSADIQNEMLMVMSLNVLREVARNLQNTLFYTVMVDEATDCSNKEQVVLVLRWVDDTLTVNEDFIGLYNVPSISADTLTGVIKDSLCRLNLTLRKVRGQCYDGASNMSGVRTGVAKQLLDEEKRAVFTHCYGHALNLACSDTVKGCKVLKDSLETTREITKLVKFSPKREILFRNLKQDIAPDTPGIRVLCPTRWTVRGERLGSVIANYAVLQETFEESIDTVTDTEVKSRLIGVSAQMKTFNFFFGTLLGELVLKHSDNLSRTLQHDDISAAEGQEVAALTISTLQSIRSDSMFDLFWEKVQRLREADGVDIDPPVLPRRRKAPKRLEVGCGEPSHAQSPKDMYRRFYFEALDLVITAVKNRFDQPGYQTYKNLQELLLQAARGQDYHKEFEYVVNFYGSDFESSQLDTQLQHLSTHFKSCSAKQSAVSLKDVCNYLQSLSKAQRSFYSQVVVLITLILVMPATNASSERSFSALRRVKTYLRSTMSQPRLNSLMVLHVHKELTDRLNLLDVANEFVANKLEHRLNIFGKFTREDFKIPVGACSTS